MERSRLGLRPLDSSEELLPEASKSFKEVQLRLLLKEREDVVTKLVDLDYNIWIIEEFFRSGSP